MKISIFQKFDDAKSQFYSLIHAMAFDDRSMKKAAIKNLNKMTIRPIKILYLNVGVFSTNLSPKLTVTPTTLRQKITEELSDAQSNDPGHLKHLAIPTA